MLETYKNLALDPFQREALDAISKGESVIVAAPTGAGKTLIAEYAIEKALREGRRVIYTAPIKALSNQKFRDFSASHPGDVGITTGDVAINPTAPATIMTTEIFRNTIFDAPERLKDVATVIFDEIHYMDDPERGTVWEESLIFAPPEIKVVALSATISNLSEFAEWLREVRGGAVRVVLERERPVPLSVFAATPEHGIVPWEKLRSVRERARSFRRRRTDDRPERGESLARYFERLHHELVHQVSARRDLPLLFFLFSRDACERLAVSCSHTDFFFGNAERRRLAQDDLWELLKAYDLDPGDPDVSRLHRLVSKGIAYHHAGLLPAIKEVVEILFQDGHVRLLCATETFALGVNMPARAVAFEGLRKFNGVTRVPLKTREFQQMAGRAGRRGIDTHGHVYATVDPERDDPHVLETLVKGEVEPIESQFNLSYATLLNLYSRLGDRIFEACARSFASFRSRKKEREAEASGAPPKRRRHEHEESHDPPPREDARFLSKREKNKRKGGGGRRSRPGRAERASRREGREQDFGFGDDPRETAPPRPAGHVSRYDDMVEQVERKLQLLRDLGYLEGRELTKKGRFASRVYGHELETTELVFEGVFDRLDAARTAVVAAAIVHESRRESEMGGVDPRRALGEAWRTSARIVKSIHERELALRVRYPVKLLDWKLTGVVWAWASGEEFPKLRDLTDASDGDIVRSLRQAIQLMRLCSQPLAELARGDLVSRFQGALRAIKRGLVDAEWQLRRAAELEAERLEEMKRGVTHSAPVERPANGEGPAATG
ncbi:DEAD/DEAH box helicase [bacterium]|nr:DEAD/DEAH box helicase [bacterium]